MTWNYKILGWFYDINDKWCAFLGTAASTGDLAEMKELLDKGAIIDLVDTQGYKPVYHAFANNQIPAARLLIEEKNAKFTLEDKGAADVCFSALKSENFNVALGLLNKAGVKLASVADQHGNNLLLIAAVSSNTEKVEYALAINGIDINKKNVNNDTPLSIAASQFRWDLALKLIEKGANISGDQKFADAFNNQLFSFNKPNEMFFNFAAKMDKQFISEGGNTTIIDLAGKYYGADKVKFLLKNGFSASKASIEKAIKSVDPMVLAELGEPSAIKKITDKNPQLAWNSIKYDNLEMLKKYFNPKILNAATDQEGNSPLHEAAKYGHPEIMSWLCENGAEVSKPNKTLNTPLHLCARTMRPQMMEYLVNKNANINAVNSKFETPLHLAIQTSAPIAKQLYDKGARLHSLEKGNELLLSLAKEGLSLKLEFMLLRKLADVDCKDLNGDTPLSIAVQHNYIINVETLLGHGADANHINGKNESVLYTAINSGKIDIAKLLFSNRAHLNPNNKAEKELLITLAKQGDDEMFKFLVEKKLCDLSLKDSDGNDAFFYLLSNYKITLLEWCEKQQNSIKPQFEHTKSKHKDLAFKAVKDGKLAVVKYMIEHGFKAESTDILNHTLKCINADIADYLISNVGATLAKTSDCGTILRGIVNNQDAAKSKPDQYLKCIDICINQGLDPLPVQIDAIRIRHADALHKLTKSGTIDFTTDAKKEILSIIGSNKSVDFIQKLIENKTLNVDAMPVIGNSYTSLLIKAIESKSHDMVEMLCKKGANLNLGNGQTLPVYKAIDIGDNKSIDILVKYGVAKEYHGLPSPAYCASQKGMQYAAIKLLGNPNEVYENKFLVFHAIDKGQWDFAHAITEHKAFTQFSYLLLIKAIDAGQEDVVKTCLLRGKDLCKAPPGAISAFDYAKNKWGEYAHLNKFGAETMKLLYDISPYPELTKMPYQPGYNYSVYVTPDMQHGQPDYASKLPAFPVPSAPGDEIVYLPIPQPLPAHYGLYPQQPVLYGDMPPATAPGMND